MSCFPPCSPHPCPSFSETRCAPMAAIQLDGIIQRLGFLAEYAAMAARPGFSVAYLDGFAAVLGDVIADAAEVRDTVAAVAERGRA